MNVALSIAFGFFALVLVAKCLWNLYVLLFHSDPRRPENGNTSMDSFEIILIPVLTILSVFISGNGLLSHWPLVLGGSTLLFFVSYSPFIWLIWIDKQLAKDRNTKSPE